MPSSALTQRLAWAVGSLPNVANGLMWPLALPTAALARLGSIVAREPWPRRRSARKIEARIVRESFGRYVPESVARAIIANDGALHLERRVATVLFADMEGFTALAERMQPLELVDLLNAYFGALGEVISRHGGSVNQFQGDAVLATFNLPFANPGHAADAVRAALEIQTLLASRSFDGTSLRSRIGINTGEMVAAPVGGGARLSYAVHGDAVNLAARLEQMNKEFGTRILASESTMRAAGEEFAFQSLGMVSVRGKSAAVSVYQLTPSGEGASGRLPHVTRSRTAK